MDCEHNSSQNALIFGQYAKNYALNRPQYPAALWQWVASLCETHDHAWDAGCGNGQATIALAQHFHHVTASDISAAQIEAAPVHPRVSYQVAPSDNISQAMHFAPQSLDLICVAQALHWFDLKTFWPIARAALKPRGVFVAIAYGKFEISPEIDAITKQSFIDVVEPYQAEGNRMVAREYADIAFPFEMMEAPMLAIECEWNIDQVMNYAATWSAVARMRKESGMDPIPAYRSALEAVGASSSSAWTVRMPLVVKAGILSTRR